MTYVPVEADGRVTADAVAQALRDDTVLISVMYANNETGMVQPIDAIGALARQKGIAFHVMPSRPLATCYPAAGTGHRHAHGLQP